MKNKFYLLPILTFSFLIQGCIATARYIPPTKPSPPKTYWETVESVVQSGVEAPSSQWVGDLGVIDLAGKTIGIDNFGGNATGAPLASQAITRKLLNVREASGNKFAVVDRSTLEKRRNELQMANSGFLKLEKAQQLQMLGEAIAADYLLDGSVVDYSSDQKTLILKQKFRDGEFSRYESEYTEWQQKLMKDKTAAEAQLGSPEAMLLASIKEGTYLKLNRVNALLQDDKTPEYYMEKLRTRSDSRSANIAAVAVTARLIDVRTGEFVWLYQAEKRGSSLMNTMKVTMDELTNHMLKKTMKK